MFDIIFFFFLPITIYLGLLIGPQAIRGTGLSLFKYERMPFHICEHTTGHDLPEYDGIGNYPSCSRCGYSPMEHPGASRMLILFPVEVKSEHSTRGAISEEDAKYKGFSPKDSLDRKDLRLLQ